MEVINFIIFRPKVWKILNVGVVFVTINCFKF
jgi:hypothetical protein